MAHASHATQSSVSRRARKFDIASLHQLRAEIEESLKAVELQISEFIDDESTAPQLADTLEMMVQNRSVLELIELEGARELTDAIIDALEHFIKTSDNTQEELIFALSEGVMLLGRYIEFVLLRETLQPRLLLTSINNIRKHLNQPLLGEGMFEQVAEQATDGKDNFKSTRALGSAALYLQKVFRTGLVSVIGANNAKLSENAVKQAGLMYEASRFAHERLGTSFWQAAMLATDGIHARLPLSPARKRTLSFVERQFSPYANDLDSSKFKDLMVMAASQNNDTAQAFAKSFSLAAVNDDDFSQMDHFMNGPNRSVVDAVDKLIQEEINQTKDRIDMLARDEVFEIEKYREVAVNMRDLALRLYMLGLKSAAQKVMQEAKVITSWQQKPSSKDYDGLLLALLYAENASTLMARSHTPGVISLPLNNTNISLHQLDTAFNELIKEARNTLANAQNSILAYAGSKEKDKLHLANLPVMLYSVGGAMIFVDVVHGYKLLSRASKYVASMLKAHDEVPQLILERIADIISGADYFLESIEAGRPAGEQPLVLSAHSLKQLLAAA